MTFCPECGTRDLKCGTRGSYTRKKRATNEDSTPRITDVILTSECNSKINHVHVIKLSFHLVALDGWHCQQKNQ